MNKNSDCAPIVAEEWLVDGGEMGRLIRAMDWSQTPLGPRQWWSQSLRTTVNLCLESNFPISMIWGPQRIQIYNDGYWPICGVKHPHAMGQDFRECWASAWPAIGAAFESAAEGQAAFLVNQRMFLDRMGFLEEAFFTFSFSPIRDEQGTIGGLFHPVTELTEQTLAERRLKALRMLADDTANAMTVALAIACATKSLAAHTLDLPFVLIYLIDSDGKSARLAGATGLPAGTPASPESIDLAASSDVGWPLARVVAARHSETVDRLEARLGPLTCGPYPEPMRDAMLLPIIPAGLDQPLAVVVAGVSTRRPLDPLYRTFYEMLGNGITTALSNARSYELERQRAEALAELDRAKTAFFSNVSHEFRTPLTLMLGPLEETINDPDSLLAENDRQRIQMVHRNALRLQKLVNSLLDFSRIEAGRAQATYTPINLAKFTAELVAMFRSAIEQAGLELIADCRPLAQPVYVDADMWEKIVLNLLSNAFKFTFAGTITVRLQWRDGGAALTVADTGTGVPPEHVPRLFERFHRVPHARSRAYEGSGIGLALAHELVKLHGGTIDVDSELGNGTTFTVFIPGGVAHLPADRIGAQPTLVSTAIDARAFVEEARHWLPAPVPTLALPAAVAPVTDSAAPLATANAGPRARILLADDNADMRDFVRRLLVPYWDVETVTNGIAALAAVQRQTPDLILTDIMMPELDGIGLLAALRANERTRATPVILLSARAGEEARVDGLRAGADDYLVKPFGARELLARINAHLNIAGLRRDAVASASNDSATGQPNRKQTLERAEQLLADAQRTGTRLGVLIINMDRFKPINDAHGREVGDAVLREIAHRLKACVDTDDMVGRLGADEFLAVLSHVNDGSDTVQVVRHIIDVLAQPYHIAGVELRTSPSIGIALFADDGNDIDQLIRHADLAMQHAKQHGRNNFQFFTQQLNDRAALALHIESHLRGGLQHREFELYYQPVVDITRHALVGVEALLRWPGTGLGPDDFIPVAENSGMIIDIGEWIIDESCRQVRQWRDRLLPKLLLSINVSPVQLQKSSLYEVIMKALTTYDIAPTELQLEITETAMVRNTDEAISSIRALNALGVKIALDDFGKGYSNLSYLGKLPLNTLKIDQMFVSNMTADPASGAVTDAIIAIGKTLGLRVVAEGVESDDVVALLREKQCNFVQGYLLCPPVPANALEDWYLRWQACAEYGSQARIH